MRAIKALVLTGTIAGLLTWFYCVFRIYTGQFPFSAEFIDGIPITFLHISIAAFIIFNVCLFLYLCLDET